MPNLKPVPVTCTNPHRAALESVRAALKSQFLERDDIVDGLLGVDSSEPRVAVQAVVDLVEKASGPRNQHPNQHPEENEG